MKQIKEADLRGQAVGPALKWRIEGSQAAGRF